MAGSVERQVCPGGTRAEEGNLGDVRFFNRLKLPDTQNFIQFFNAKAFELAAHFFPSSTASMICSRVIASNGCMDTS
jgi:hypothetical protein